ncbi:hypothetical protein [Lichenibacterium dinghuense]|uniref:hypothetical protein n=1 Tax=Lichenibacterium dinghuense TaxID=2895977 RepID=UPI001F2BC212|nr:hypothetical protein [Lichenibacterium sp. 6Y81]
MKHILSLGLAVAVLLGAVSDVQAADRIVRLQTPPEVMKGVAAMPFIAGPEDEAERRINAALLRLDTSARRAAVQCRTAGGKDSWWERNIQVPMSGPRFLSYEITDNISCGGAHPDVSTMSIVYDLTNGAPVDWMSLLPTALTGKPALASGADGTKMVTLSGQTLYALYLTGYRPRSGDVKNDGDDDECRGAVADAGDGGSAPGMMAWIDAKKDGLVVQFDLPHVVQACADSVTIPIAALRAVGAQPILIEALTKAHEGSSGVR